MPLIQLVVVLIIIGVLLYLMNRYVPMAAWVKTAINWIVAIAVMIWLLQVFGLWPSNIPLIRVGH